MQSKQGHPHQSRTFRHILGVTCIISGFFCAFLMDIPSMISDFPAPSATGFIEWQGGKVPILKEFHWIPLVDSVIKDITVGFAPSAFGYDDISRWLMRPFMFDMGVWYMVLLMESLRPGNKGTVARIPSLLVLIAQIVGGGFFVPFIYGLFLIFTTPIESLSPAQRRIDLKSACLYVPLVLVFHYASVVGMYWYPSLEGRHYWSWFWQLHPVRTSVAHGALSFLINRLSQRKDDTSQRARYLQTVSMILAPFIAISAMTWIYTIVNCPYPLAHVFAPQELFEDTWVGRLRRILQLDYAFLNAMGLAWIFGLLRDAGLVGIGGTMRFMLVAGISTIMMGPAAALGCLWLWREKLAQRETDVAMERARKGSKSQ